MKYKWLWPALAAVLLLGILVLLLMGKENVPAQPATPTQQVETTEPTQETKDNTPVEEQTTPSLPQELPPEVALPVETDPATGATLPVTFPATVEGYDLVIEKLAPYDGLFVEDGSNVQVQGVAMLMLKNNSDFPLEYGQILVEYETVTLTFAVTALPEGQRLVVQEQSGQPVPEGAPKACRALLVQRAEMTLSADKLSVVDNGDDTITVTNLTDQTIPAARLFYKYYMEDQQMYVGGIAFTVRLTELQPGLPVSVRASHYNSDTGKVVMVLTYNEEG